MAADRAAQDEPAGYKAASGYRMLQTGAAVGRKRKKLFPGCRNFHAGTVQRFHDSSSTCTSLSKEGFIKLRKNRSGLHCFIQRIRLIPLLPWHIGDCQRKPKERILGAASGLWPLHGLHIAVCHKRLLSYFISFYLMCRGKMGEKK